MNPAEINKTIAEYCGWHHLEIANTMAIHHWYKGYPPIGEIIGKKQTIPNYYDDLNAIHNVENFLISQQGDMIFRYYDMLAEIQAKSAGYESCLYLLSASAQQRAIALNKMIETQKK